MKNPKRFVKCHTALCKNLVEAKTSNVRRVYCQTCVEIHESKRVIKTTINGECYLYCESCKTELVKAKSKHVSHIVCDNCRHMHLVEKQNRRKEKRKGRIAIKELKCKCGNEVVVNIYARKIKCDKCKQDEKTKEKVVIKDGKRYIPCILCGELKFAENKYATYFLCNDCRNKDETTVEKVENINNIQDSEEKIYCRHCFKFFKKISFVHLAKHGLTPISYTKLYNDPPTISKQLIRSNAAKTFGAHLKNNNLYSRFGHSGYRKDIGLYVRSMIEANFIRILKFNSVRFKYEPNTYKLFDSKFLSYTPDILLLDDFYTWKKEFLIELKRYFGEGEQEKIRDFKNEYPNLNIFVLETRSLDWKTLFSRYRYQIPLWEDSVQNIKTRPDLYKVF